jgi:hypothetical protein
MLNRIRDFLLLFPASSFKKLLGGVAVLVLILFPIGIFSVNKIDDNLDFGKNSVDPASASKSVAVAVQLIDREINQHEWTANDPFFRPGAWLERMPAFQKGIISAVSRFAIEMGDQIGRTRGSSQIDADLDKAAGMLKYPPDVWVYNFSVSIFPTASSERQYLGAMKALQRYNTRLARGEAVFERRADNLQATLDRIALDLGAASAGLANSVTDPSLLDTNADVLFYDVKGRMYAYYLLLEGLKLDYHDIIVEKQLSQAWDEMEKSLAEGANLNVFFVLNNKPDSQLLPNHLSAMGFYLLRSRTQLKEITNILLK